MHEIVKKLLPALIVVLCSNSAYAAAYLSNQNGNPACDGFWKTSQCWSPAGVPGPADTWTIRSGDTITITDSRSIGAGIIGTTSAGDTATLVVGVGAVVTVGGDLSLATATNQSSLLRLAAGSTLDMGPNTLVLGAGTNGAGVWRFESAGTSAARVTVTGTGVMTYGFSSTAGSINWSYTTFEGFGGGINNIGMQYSSSVTNCLFKFEGEINFGYNDSVALRTSEDLIFADNDFRQIADVGIYTKSGQPQPGRLRRFSGNTFYSPGGAPTLSLGVTAAGGYLTGADNHFYNWKISEQLSGNTTLSGNSYYHPASMTSGSSYLALGGGGTRISDSVFFSEGANNHGVYGGQGVHGGGRNEIIGNIFDNVYKGNTANAVIPGYRTGTLISGNLFIANGMEAVTYGLIPLKESSSAIHDVQQNTFIMAGSNGGDGVFWEGEAGHVQPGILNVRNNIFWHDRTGTDLVAQGNAASLPDWIDYIDSNVMYSVQGVLTPYNNVVIAVYTDESVVPTYKDSTSFMLPGNLATRYSPGKVVKIFNDSNQGVTRVTSSSYDAASDTTTVTVNDAYLTAALSAVSYQAGQKNVGAPGYGSRDAALAVDPRFVDPARTIATYTGSTKEAFFHAMLTRNGHDENGFAVTPATAWSVADLVKYLRDGFTPQNTDLLGAGEGGVDLGAVPVSSSPGDVNRDGTVNVFDALLTLQYAVGLYVPADLPTFTASADVAPLDSSGKPERNGTVDVFDALAILRHAVGLDGW